MSGERIQPQPDSVVGLNNPRFPENPGSGATATDKLPTVALAPLAVQLEVMDWEGGAQRPKPLAKGNGNKS